MTNNQINYWKLQEDVRSHKAQEAHNSAQLAENTRHNIRSETIDWYGLEETQRANIAKEGETQRHNSATESFNLLSLDESTRSHMANENIGYANVGVGWGNIDLGYARNELGYAELAHAEDVLTEQARHAQVTEKEQQRHNIAVESETYRSNLEQERLIGERQKEDVRHHNVIESIEMFNSIVDFGLKFGPKLISTPGVN